MKKQIALLAAVVMTISLVACGKTEGEDSPSTSASGSSVQESSSKDLQDSATKETEELYYEEGMQIDHEYGEPTEDFYMEVSDVFTITGKGVVVTGTTKNSPIYLGTEVDVLTADGRRLPATVIKLEQLRETYTGMDAESICGMVIKCDWKRDETQSGDVVVLKGCEDPRVPEEEETAEEIVEHEISYEYGEMTDDFYLEVRTFHKTDDFDGVIVNGVTQNSPLYLYSEMELVTTKGVFPCKVVYLNRIGECDGVDTYKDCTVGLLGIKKKDVSEGDILVRKGCSGNWSDYMAEKAATQEVIESDLPDGEYGQMTDDFYFEYRDAITFPGEKNIVNMNGTTYESPLYVGTEVSVQVLGEYLPAVVEVIKVDDEEVTGVDEDEDCTIILSGVTMNDVRGGSRVYLRVEE